MGSEEDVKSGGRSPSQTENSKSTGHSFDLRPSASNGLWLCCLVPLAYSAGLWKNKHSLTFEYKLSTIIAVGLFLQSIEIFVKITSPHRINHAFGVILKLVPIVVTAALVRVCLHQGAVFSCFIGNSTMVLYSSAYIYTLKHLPKSFTLGEASIVVQGFVLFISITFLKLLDIVNFNPKTTIEEMSTILQIGLLGVVLIVACCHCVKRFRGIAFYPLLALVGLIVMLFPIGGNLAVIVLFEFIFRDVQRICIASIYLGLLGLTVATIIWHVSKGRESNTRVRKIFHILIVLVFIPGLIYQCTFLFVASGVALALLVVLEVARVIQLPPLNGILQQAVKAFIDEKDAGAVALTPIYLLVGCSLPLWIHPTPCDLTDSAGFQLLALLSGVLSVGIGDTAASVIGSKFGRLKYPGSIKTVEGTVAAILAQGLLLPIMIYFGFVHQTPRLLLIYSMAIVTNSLVETFTDQVDNLVLPLVTYALLSLC